jgi:hypothetical protein
MAGNAVIGALRVNLGLDSAEFQNGAKKAQSTLAGLGAAIKGFAAGAVAGLSLGARGEALDGRDVTLVSASAKGAILSDVALLADITGATTYADYRDALRAALFTAAPAVGEDVVIQPSGALEITGAAGASEAITGIVIGAGPNPGDDQRSAFSSSQSFRSMEYAR